MYPEVKPTFVTSICITLDESMTVMSHERCIKGVSNHPYLYRLFNSLFMSTAKITDPSWAEATCYQGIPITMVQ